MFVSEEIVKRMRHIFCYKYAGMGVCLRQRTELGTILVNTITYKELWILICSHLDVPAGVPGSV